jgi:chromosome segregation ATPase
MSEFNLEESLNKIEEVLENTFDEMLKIQAKYKEEIEELKQANNKLMEENKKLLKEKQELRNGNEYYGIIIDSLDEKNKKLLKENEELRWRVKVGDRGIAMFEKENEFLRNTINEISKASLISNPTEDIENYMKKHNEKVNALNKALIVYLEENLKLMQSNQHLTNEIERLKIEIKRLSDENKSLKTKIDEYEQELDINYF